MAGGSGSIGLFKTATGINMLGGDVIIASGKAASVAGGAGNIDFSGSTGLFKTSTGAGTVAGSLTTDASTGDNVIASSEFDGALELGAFWLSEYTDVYCWAVEERRRRLDGEVSLDVARDEIRALRSLLASSGEAAAWWHQQYTHPSEVRQPPAPSWWPSWLAARDRTQ